MSLIRNTCMIYNILCPTVVIAFTNQTILVGGLKNEIPGKNQKLSLYFFLYLFRLTRGSTGWWVRTLSWRSSGRRASTRSPSRPTSSSSGLTSSTSLSACSSKRYSTYGARTPPATVFWLVEKVGIGYPKVAFPESLPYRNVRLRIRIRIPVRTTELRILDLD